MLLAVGVGGGFGFTGQRLLVEGQTFSNSLVAYDSFNPGRWFQQSDLQGYNLKLDKFVTKYEEKNLNALGQALDYDATVTTTTKSGQTKTQRLGVNDPVSIGGTNVYLLGNGYAMQVTVRDGKGNVAFKDVVPFLPQDANYTSSASSRCRTRSPTSSASRASSTRRRRRCRRVRSRAPTPTPRTRC